MALRRITPTFDEHAQFEDVAEAVAKAGGRIELDGPKVHIYASARSLWKIQRGSIPKRFITIANEPNGFDFALKVIAYGQVDDGERNAEIRALGRAAIAEGKAISVPLDVDALNEVDETANRDGEAAFDARELAFEAHRSFTDEDRARFALLLSQLKTKVTELGGSLDCLPGLGTMRVFAPLGKAWISDNGSSATRRGKTIYVTGFTVLMDARSAEYCLQRLESALVNRPDRSSPMNGIAVTGDLGGS